MTLMKNDFIGMTANEVLSTLQDLGIEVTYIDKDDDEIMFIETEIDYSIDFCNGICCWAGYEEEVED